MSIKLPQWIWSWLPLAVVISLLSLMAYGAGQQVLRQSANDPQIQIAEDTARQLEQGLKPDDVIGKSVDVAASLSPGVMVYDHSGKLLAASLQSDGSTPSYPKGALAYARSHGRDIITWQLGGGVRLASVAIAGGSPGSDVVVVARSLREVEDRESALFNELIAGWLVTLLVSLLAVWWSERKKSA